MCWGYLQSNLLTLFYGKWMINLAKNQDCDRYIMCDMDIHDDKFDFLTLETKFRFQYFHRLKQYSGNGTWNMFSKIVTVSLNKGRAAMLCVSLCVTAFMPKIILSTRRQDSVSTAVFMSS